MKPFFLWIDSFDPHEPFDPPQAYADLYCPGYQGKDFIMECRLTGIWQRVEVP